MTEFFEKTWFLWWILADLLILRWFYLLRSPDDFEADLEDSEMDAHIASRASLSPAWPIHAPHALLRRGRR